MDSKFTIIESTDAENKESIAQIYKTVLVNMAWERQFFGFIEKASLYGHDTVKAATQDELMKIGLSGVKYVCSLCEIRKVNIKLGDNEPETLEESKAMYQLIDFLFYVLGGITLRNFVVTFPVTKFFDGEKWESKDYFFTMDVLSGKDLDKPIGKEHVFDLLWDYVNDDLRKVNIEYMSVMSRLYHVQTGGDLLDRIFEDSDMHSHTIDHGAGIIIDNRTGEIGKIKKARHLQIVK